MFLKFGLKMKITFLLFSLIIFLPVNSLSREFSPQEIEKLKSLVQDLRPLAEEDKPAAQNNLGEMYFNGYGVAQNYEEALNWFQKAASQNFAKAQYNMALMYYHGNGIIKNHEETQKYLKLACENGFVLGCTEMVSFVSDDNEKAKYYQNKACNIGYQTSCAMLKLGENKIGEAKSILKAECDKGDKNACRIMQKVIVPLEEGSPKAKMQNASNKAFKYIAYINIALVALVASISIIVQIVLKNKKKKNLLANNNQNQN